MREKELSHTIYVVLEEKELVDTILASCFAGIKKV